MMSLEKINFANFLERIFVFCANQLHSGKGPLTKLSLHDKPVGAAPLTVFGGYLRT